MHTFEIILHAFLIIASLTFMLLMSRLRWETSIEGWGSMLLAVSGILLGASFWVESVEVIGWISLIVCMCLRVCSVLKSRKSKR